ncbi:glycosyltransferase [Verrucomicrobiales bacterium]|nr:glycosyltransferase [Verrucomicrobiales bacterium]
MGEPRVSVVLPAYNAEATISEALESLAAQTYRDFEVIVVDDGSTDDTRTIGERAGAKVVSLAQNSGVVAAANRGFAEARGELIARMDADDFAYPERLAKQVAALDANLRWGACATGVLIVGEDVQEGFLRFAGWSNALLSPEEIARERFIDQPVVNPTTMVRRAVAERFPLRGETGWAEDYDFWLRVIGAGVEVGKLPEVLLDWRDSPGRLTRTGDEYSLAAFSRAKAHFLARMSGKFSIAGAGPIGKSLAHDLRAEGAEVVAFYDVHPRRIGNTIHGIPVFADTAIIPGGPVLLSAVGVPGAREKVRACAAKAGYEEGDNFFCIA